jgi:hypothetical protein
MGGDFERKWKRDCFKSLLTYRRANVEGDKASGAASSYRTSRKIIALFPRYPMASKSGRKQYRPWTGIAWDDLSVLDLLVP